MADVQWIKIKTDMFDNRKIKHLRKLPDGNNIVLIWVMILTIAGRCNASGRVFLTESIPYTTKLLADELDFKEKTVKLALEALEQFGMISRESDVLFIPGWEEHQNAEALEKLREQTRKRVARHREKKKSLACNVSCNVTGSYSNATEEDIEKEKDKDKDNISASDEVDTPTQNSTKRIVFNPPTLEEVQAYCSERNNNVDAERFIDFYKSKGWMIGKNKMEDWKAAVRSWERNSTDRKEIVPDLMNQQKKSGFNSVSSRDYNMNDLEVQLLGADEALQKRKAELQARLQAEYCNGQKVCEV